MERQALEYLKEWKGKPGRKPLVVRGARQVGKSYLIRQFGELFPQFVELNFEMDREAARLFESPEPKQLLQRLELYLGRDIRPGQTLLFLDEIQAAPQALVALRYLYELIPELHVIAAGSLLEFAFESSQFSVPVGRLEYMHMGPMTFEESLLAGGQGKMLEFLRTLDPRDEVPLPIHERLNQHLRAFMAVGGLPAAQAAWHQTGSYRAAEEVKQSILQTYEEDFGKYGGRVDRDTLRLLFRQLPQRVGRKLVWASIDRNQRSTVLASALDLLCKARVVQKVIHSDGSGVPLGATTDERRFKPLFLDVGLVATACGISALDLERGEDLAQINNGSLAEQFVGQHLLHSGPAFARPELYYWVREKKNASAEVDYLGVHKAGVYPIEVKAGQTGKLKSLHMFLQEKNRPFGIRLSGAPPSIVDAMTSLPGYPQRQFQLLNLPLYLAGQVGRLVESVRD